MNKSEVYQHINRVQDPDTRSAIQSAFEAITGDPSNDGIIDDGASVVMSVTNPVTGGITKIWTGTQAAYDALTPADDTLYVIKD